MSEEFEEKEEKEEQEMIEVSRIASEDKSICKNLQACKYQNTCKFIHKPTHFIRCSERKDENKCTVNLGTCDYYHSRCKDK